MQTITDTSTGTCTCTHRFWQHAHEGDPRLEVESYAIGQCYVKGCDCTEFTGESPATTEPAAETRCRCDHAIGLHVELEAGYAPCSASCDCDDYDEYTGGTFTNWPEGMSDPTLPAADIWPFCAKNEHRDCSGQAELKRGEVSRCACSCHAAAPVGEPEWSGACDPCDPANYWIDDQTGERVNAATGERSSHTCPPVGEQAQPEWYEAKTGNHQGLIIDERTGRNIAVTYDKVDAPIIVTAVNTYASNQRKIEVLKDVLEAVNEVVVGCDPEWQLQRLAALAPAIRAAIEGDSK